MQTYEVVPLIMTDHDSNIKFSLYSFTRIDTSHSLPYSNLHVAYYKSFWTNSHHKFLLSSQSFTYHFLQPIYTPPHQ
jgi:hypothetical protein